MKTKLFLLICITVPNGFQEENVASELKDPIWHSSEWQIGSFSSEATNVTLHKMGRNVPNKK